MLISETIRLFLDSIGRSEEYEYYLKKFRSDRSSCFAVLCPDEEACDVGGENLRLSLQFLQRLDLVPAVLLTGPRAPQMRAALTRSGLSFTTYRPKRRCPPRSFGETEAQDSNQAGDVELVFELGAAVQLARTEKKAWSSFGSRSSCNRRYSFSVGSCRRGFILFAWPARCAASTAASYCTIIIAAMTIG